MASVFFSYSHADEGLRDRLETHLAMLKRQGLINAWHDRRIVAGGPVDRTISDELERADLILLLVSPEFLASDYCYEREMKRALERHEAGEARVMPVILRPCDWQEAAPFRHLLATPTDGKPVTRFPDLDEAFLDVTRAIRKALASMAQLQPKQPNVLSMPVSSSVPGPCASTQARPRSSNLRLRKTFTDADRDRFLDGAFEYMARFFENSLQELAARNTGTEGDFKRIDAHQFTAIVYQHGKAVSRCRVFMDRSFGSGIAYASGNAMMGGGQNESLSVHNDDQGLFLRALMGNLHGQQVDKVHLTYEGAAEYYWTRFIEDLQR